MVRETSPAWEASWETTRAAFQRIWGYADFRPPQGEIVQTLLSGRDALVVMPTGGGKSICFQLPALLQQGLTLVISPLVALMENQVAELQQKQLPAGLIHSQLPKADRQRLFTALERQQLRLLYLSPETLFSAPVWERLVQPDLKINGLILDEAHCLAQWGDTFRPAYRRLGTVRPALLQHKSGNRSLAIAAFTATADPKTQQVIEQVLQLHNPQRFCLNPYRSNLHLSIQTIWTPKGRKQRLLQFIQAHPRQSGLVYVRTRRHTEELAQWLQQQHLQTAAYHGGLGATTRRQLETAWLDDRLQFVVCTNAFGMGINKPQVRWVLHYQLPLLLAEYVQEVGRAGRDGDRAQALALVSECTGWLDNTDQKQWQFFSQQLQHQYQTAQTLARRLPPQGTIGAISRQFKQGEIALSLLHTTGQLTWHDPFLYQLHKTGGKITPPPHQAQVVRQLQQFLRTPHCRWQFLLRAFGFNSEAETMGACGHCDRCLGKKQW